MSISSDLFTKEIKIFMNMENLYLDIFYFLIGCKTSTGKYTYLITYNQELVKLDTLSFGPVLSYVE